jgi:uncharacterized membrane protein
MSGNTDSSGPAAAYRHEHPPVRNVLEEHEEVKSLGQRVADKVAAGVGSWPFIILQSLLLIAWMAMNVYLVTMLRVRPHALKAWDPYPFILLNLVLSFQAAYTGPVVMMSQNRQTEKDRLVAEHDFEINRKAEEEIQVIMRHLVHQDRLLLDVARRLEAHLASLPPAEAMVAPNSSGQPPGGSNA